MREQRNILIASYLQMANIIGEGSEVCASCDVVILNWTVFLTNRLFLIKFFKIRM